MKLIKVNEKALAGFNQILSLSSDLQQVRDADWFDTPMKRMQWWMDLEKQWKQAFCEGVFYNQIKPDTLPADEQLIHIFELEHLELCGNWKSNAPRNNNADIDLALTNLSGVRNLTNITRLDIDYNGYIDSLEPISHLKKLQIFWFDNNAVSDLSPLMGLPNLVDICFWNNKVTSIEPLLSVPNLARLALTIYGFGNPIEDYEPLKDMLHLKHLFVNKEELSDDLLKQLAHVKLTYT